MEEMVKIIRWNDGCDEPNPCCRLDDPDGFSHFGRALLNNAEADGRDKLTIEFVTKEQWVEIDRIGREMA